MIGLLVTGHAQFASGITSACQLICGELQDYEVVDFASTDSEEILKQNLNAAFDRLQHCDGILVFTDLLGGSPFKTAVILSLERQNIKVMAGTNLPTLIETNMMRASQTDVEETAKRALQTAKEQACIYEYIEVEETCDEDGI